MAGDGSDQRTATDLTGTAESVVRAYYAALRAGDPLDHFFADGDVVKVGISERLVGGDAVRAGLREQTRTTTDWTVESRDLHVTDRGGYAWFADRVTMGWTDRRIRYEFDTRWSGTMERRTARDGSTADHDAPAGDAPWRFVGMHVSTPGEL